MIGNNRQNLAHLAHDVAQQLDMAVVHIQSVRGDRAEDLILDHPPGSLDAQHVHHLSSKFMLNFFFVVNKGMVFVAIV